MRGAGLGAWVNIHEGTAESVATEWKKPIDLLILDGDQSQNGARSGYEKWVPHLKSGGTIWITNSSEREYEPDHAGNRLVVVESIQSPHYSGIATVGYSTIARKVGDR